MATGQLIPKWSLLQEVQYKIMYYVLIDELGYCIPTCTYRGTLVVSSNNYQLEPTFRFFVCLCLQPSPPSPGRNATVSISIFGNWWYYGCQYICGIFLIARLLKIITKRT